jgi:hypothetical protein
MSDQLSWPEVWPDEDDECYECGGEGIVLRDCFEDTCCCADPDLQHGYELCPVCQGRKPKASQS